MQRKRDSRKKADSQAGRNALIMPAQCTCQAQWINCDTKGIARSQTMKKNPNSNSDPNTVLFLVIMMQSQLKLWLGNNP